MRGVVSSQVDLVVLTVRSRSDLMGESRSESKRVGCSHDRRGGETATRTRFCTQCGEETVIFCRLHQQAVFHKHVPVHQSRGVAGFSLMER